MDKTFKDELIDDVLDRFEIKAGYEDRKKYEDNLRECIGFTIDETIQKL